MLPQKVRWIVLFMFSLALIWILAACGSGQNETEAPPVETPSSAKATQAPSQAENKPASQPTPTQAAHAEPTAAEVEKATAAEIAEATTVRQAAQLLDLRTLSLPDKAELMGQAEVGYINYQAPLAVAAVVDLYRPLLTEQGWQELSDQSHVDDVTAVLYFGKNNFSLSMSASQMGENSTMVTLMNHGNVDLRALPQMTDAEAGFSAPNTLIYFSPTPVVEVGKFTRQELAALGWQIYTRPNSTSADNPDSQTLTFKQNGLDLTAYIAVAPAQDGKTSVQYSLALLPLDLPAVPEATQLEFDKTESYLSYQTSTDVAGLVEFYRREMVDLGWKESTESAKIAPDQAALLFIDKSAQLALAVDLKSVDGQTTATIHSLDSTGPAVAVEAESTPLPVEASDSTGAMPDLPIPEDAQDVVYDADVSEITYTSPSDIKTLAEFYRQALPAQGWQENEDLAMVDETIGLLEFNQGDDTLSITLMDMSGSTQVSLDVSGVSLMAESEAPDSTPTEETAPSDSPAFTIEDWPVPPEAEEVSLSGETLKYKVAGKLPDTAEFYRATFEQLGLDTDCLDKAAEYTSMSCSMSNGDFSLNFFAYEGFDNMVEVEISFTNYALDASTTGESASDAGEDSGELTAEDKDGLPVPDNYTNYSSEDSEFRRRLTFTSPSDPQTLLQFYQAELPALEWQPVGEPETAAGVTRLAFEKSDSQLTLEMKSAGDETEVSLTSKNHAAAAKAGILPPAGQARIYLANPSPEDLTVTINEQVIKVPAEAGMTSPDDAPKLDLPPQTYQVTTKSGSSSVTDEITVGVDEVWILMVGPTGALPLQMY